MEGGEEVHEEGEGLCPVHLVFFYYFFIHLVVKKKKAARREYGDFLVYFLDTTRPVYNFFLGSDPPAHQAIRFAGCPFCL